LKNNLQQDRKQQPARQISPHCFCGVISADGEGATREVFHHPWVLQQEGRLLITVFRSSELMCCNKYKIEGGGQTGETKPKMSVYVWQREMRWRSIKGSKFRSDTGTCSSQE